MITSRRSFLQTTAAATAGGLILPGAHAAVGNDTLRIGLVGCGGRGTGAAVNALMADPKVKLVAMCDAFMDRLQPSLKTLRDNKEIADKIDVTPERCFDGFDGYQKLWAAASTWCCSAPRPASGRCTCGLPSRPASTSSARSPSPSMRRACVP